MSGYRPRVRLIPHWSAAGTAALAEARSRGRADITSHRADRRHRHLLALTVPTPARWSACRVLHRSTKHLEETYRTMPTPRPLRPLLAAAAATLVATTAVTGHAISTGPAGLSDVAGATDGSALASAEHRDARRAQEARDASVRAAAQTAAQQAAQKAAQQAAQARAQRARAAARTAARKAAALRAAKAKAQAEARVKAAKQRAARSAARARTNTVAAPARTSWPALNQAIARIPGYREGIARWHVTSRYGHYGITDANQPGAANIYISPTVPASKLYSVAAHEYGHAVVIANYGTGYGPYTEYSRDMVNWFGGDRVTGLERAADCIALRLGATWTNYTGCSDGRWQEGARILLRGGRL